MARFLRPGTGNRRKRLAVVARKVAGVFRPIGSIWGFGSAFQHGRFSDIDLLVVTSLRRRSLVSDAMHIRRLLDGAVPKWGVPLHILVLTDREASVCPLRDMRLLEQLFCRQAIICRQRRYGAGLLSPTRAGRSVGARSRPRCA